MASNASKAITGKGDDLRGFSSGQEANPEIHETAPWPQERLVAVAPKNSRSRYEVLLRTCSDGGRRAVLALRDQNGRGGFRDTGPTIVFPVEHLDALQELLDALSLAAFEEGVLS